LENNSNATYRLDLADDNDDDTYYSAGAGLTLKQEEFAFDVPVHILIGLLCERHRAGFAMT